MKRYVYVTFPDGSIAKRFTARSYTHAVACLRDGVWCAAAYCGSYRLALNQLRGVSAVFPGAIILPVFE